MGIGGSDIPEKPEGFSFVLENENKSLYTMETEDVYSEKVSTVVVHHHDMSKAGLKVDYDEGMITIPSGQKIRMTMKDSVWTVKVVPVLCVCFITT